MNSTIPSWQGKTLNVTVLHTRAGVAQQVLVRTENSSVLVDVGDGSLRDLLASDVKPARINGVLITHGHYDHMGGLYSLLGFMRMIGRRDTLTIAGPEGCTELWSTVDNFCECYSDSIPYKIHRRELADRNEFTVADIKIEAYSVRHCGSIAGGQVLARIPAMGYRLSSDGETVAITGDTGYCPTLEELVTDVDMAVIEATWPPGSNVSDEQLQNVHLSEELATKVGKLARNHLLVHRIG